MSGSEEDGEDGEEDMGSNDYGDEYGEEMEEQLEAEENKRGKKKKDKDASIFASADDFAELLDKAADSGGRKEKVHAPKRKFTEFESAQRRFHKQTHSPKSPVDVRQKRKRLFSFPRWW
jgi:hypothetical protein